MKIMRNTNTGPSWTLYVALLIACAHGVGAQEAKPTNNPAQPVATAATNVTAAATTNAAAAGTNVTAAATNAQKNIRFQFDGIPYGDVLERFAQMAGKPLVADTNIQGTLTFNDPRPYNYHEALDTLNVMLSMKGVMLVEDGHYLKIVPFKEVPQLPLKILRGVDSTGDVRPGEVVTVVLELRNLDAKEVGDAVVPLLSNAGSVAPLSRGRGLILTDRLTNIQRIRTLLNAIDSETVADRQMKAFTLLHASGAVVSDLINRTFGISTARKRTQFNSQTKQLDVLPPDPSDYVTAVYDDASRTLVLFGPRERIDLAEELISKFEDKEGGGGEVRIYYPQVTKVEELAQMIRQAVPGIAAPGEAASAAATKARVIADAAQNRLVVAAPMAAQVDQIEQLINRLDKPVHGTGGAVLPTKSQTVHVTKVFRPRSSEGASVAKILTEALTKRLPSGQTVATAQVTLEPNSQSVVVTGSPGDVQTAVDIVTQLETGSTMPRAQQTKFIDVGTVAEAKRLLPLIEQIYRSQATDSIGGQTAHAKIIADAESGRLIVTASDDHLQRIEEIVRQVKVQKSPMQARRLQIVSLKHLRADAAMGNINSLIAERMAEKRFEDVPKPLVLPDNENSRLLVTSTDEQFKEIQAVVALFDIAPERAKREMVILPVQSKSASDLITLTTQLLTQSGEQTTDPQLAPKFIPDTSGKQMIVMATAKDLQRITNLVQQLDSASATVTTRHFRGVDLFSRKAAELTPLVQQLYQEQLKGQVEPAGGPATLLAEMKDNRIMVSGSEPEIARVEAIIRQLDPKGAQGGKEETRVIRLKTAVAAELAALVEKTVNAQSQKVKVLVDPRSNSLVVSGDDSGVETASQVIQQLDTRSDVQPRELRVIELKQGDAGTVAPMVTTLAGEMIKDQRGPEYVVQTKIVPDVAGNRLIVSGPKEELNAVTTVVEQLDQTPEGAGGARVFKLVMADAGTLAPVVSNAMLRFDARNQAIRRVTVSADRESNSIIVSGSRSDLQDAQSIIERLDAEGVEKGRELKIVEVRTDDADALAALATRVFAAQNSGRNVTNAVSITPEPSGKRLIVLAPATVLPQIETVISTLDNKAEQGTRELTIVELANGNAPELLPTVSRLYAEQTQGKSTKPATIQPDPSGSRLLVYGLKDQAAAIRQIVETLEQQKRSPRETKVFDLGKLAEAQRALPIVQQLYRDQVGSGGADAQMISDGKTGRVIVSARADQIAGIEEIFNRLQLAANTNQPGRETRTVEAGSPSDVQRLLPIVQQLYQDQWKDKSEADPADAQIVADPKTGRLIITGKPDHIQQIEGILKQINEGKPKSEARDTRVYDLTTANAMELSTTVRTLYQEQSKNRLGSQVADTMIFPDASANRLIVVGETNELDAVDEIIKKLDKVSAQSASTRVFRLKSADPDKVMEIISTALVRYDAYGRQQKRVSVVVDAKSRTLIATGDPKELQGVSVIIEQIDSVGALPERTMKVIQIKNAAAAELTAKVRQLYQDQIKSQPELGVADALIMEDAASNQIITAGSEAQIKLIEQILSQLQDPNAAQLPRETRVYDLNTTSAGELATTVRMLYDEQLKARPVPVANRAVVLPDVAANRLVVAGVSNELVAIDEIVKQLDKVDAQTGRTRVFKLKTAEARQVASVLSAGLAQVNQAGRNVPRITVGADEQNNLLIVSGEPKDLQAASVIVEQMDAILAKEPRQMRIVALKSGVASEMATKVRSLYQDQMKGQPKSGAADALIMGEDAGNRLIITANESHLKAIEDIIGQLQQTGETSVRELRVLTLERNSAASVATMVSQLFSRQTASLDPGERLVVTPSADDRTLVLEAATPMLEKVGQLVKSLDGAENLGKAEVRTYHIPEGNAAELAPTLSRLFIEKGGPNAAANAPRFEADGSANIIMVAASAEQFPRIDKLIEELKKTVQVASEIRTFKLEHSDPTQIATVIEAMLAEDDGPGQGRGRRRMRYTPGVGLQPVADAKIVRVAPAATLNAVVVQGPPEKLAVAEKLIQSLDKQDTEGRGVIQSVHLKKASAENLAAAVNQNIANRGPQSSVQRVTVTPVIGPNSVLINGPAEAVQEVMQIIRDLDQESEGDEIKVHIYKLENGNAKEVSSVVEQLLRNVTREQNRTRSERTIMASVAVDERSNALVISGTAAHFKLVEQLLATLDKVPQKGDKDVQFVWLRKAKAFDVALKLDAVFESRPEGERPYVEPDTFNNSITVIGKKADIIQIQDLIARLDESSKDSSLQVRLRPLDRVSADQMARMLQNIFPQMSSGRIRFVDKLTPAPKAPPTNTTATATNQAPAASNAEGAIEVVIAVDKDANALMLSGPTQYLDEIDNIITELSYSYISSDAEFRVFALKEADPVIVARTLSDLFKVEQVKVEGQQQARPGEVRTIIPAPKITIVPEPRTRSVIVRAKPTDFALMESLIKQLDVAGASSQLEYRLVALTNAPPEKLVPLVQQMVSQLNIMRPGEPLSVTPDSRTRGLLVVARDSVLAQVEKMIRSLDVAAPYAEAEVLVLSLKKASAPGLSAVLQNMLKPGTAGELTTEARELQEQVRRLKIQNGQGTAVELDLTKPIKILADPLGGQGGGNRLVLSSTADNLKALAAVVEMMDSVPLTEGVNVKLVKLQHADAAIVSQTLSTIFSQGQRLGVGPAGQAQPEGDSGKALVNPLNVAMDPRSNTLILSGKPESIELASKIIADLDSKVERFVTEVKLFRLKHASAIRMAPLLQSVFAEGPAVPGTEGLNTQVTRLRATAEEKDKLPVTEQPKARAALVVQADDTANILIVAARSDTLPIIETVVNQLDIPSASGMDTIRVYPLKHSDAVTFQKVILDLYSGPRAAQLRTEDKPNVSIDERTQALIVSANPKAFAIIDSLIMQLDKQLPLELRDVRILTLKHADAADVAASLQRLLDARVTQKSSLSKQQADSMRAMVVGEPRSNSLLISGSKDTYELIESLANELDRAPTALSGKIRLVALNYADARFITTALLNLFTQRYQAAKSPEVQRNKPIIVPDPRSNGLLIAAGVDDNAVIDELLQKLDRKLEDPALSLTVFPLRHNDAARVAPTFENLFAARLKARTASGQEASPHEVVEIVTDGLNNALIVSANKENLDTIKGLLEKIDVEPLAPGGLVQTFTLQFADAQRVAAMLRNLVQQGIYRPGLSTAAGGGNASTRRDAMAVAVDPRSNSLIVSASPENLLVIKEVLKQVDTKDLAETDNMRLYTLKHARASNLAAVLQQFLRAKRASESLGVNASERAMQVAVIPDDRVNTLLVTGSKENFDVIDRIIQQLDGQDAMAQMNFRVFPLKQATATKLQDTMQRLFANRPPRVKGEPPDPITIVADAWVNALIVGAAVDDLAMVESLVQRLDSDQAQLGITVQVFSLAKADARRVAQTVQGLFKEGTAGITLPVAVSADERLNAIVVSAGETDLKRIGDLVKKLDTDQVARVSEIRVFPLQYARAESLSTILNTALNTKPTALNDPNPNSASLLQFITRTDQGKELVASALKESVLITPDARMNSLIVSAPIDYMDLLQQIVSQLDSGTPQSAKIKVFQLVNADARQMAELLMTLFRLQPSSQQNGVQRSIQYTLVKHNGSNALKTMTASHQGAANGNGVESGSASDSGDTARKAELDPEEELASATIGTAEAGALNVTIDPRTNSLLIGGTDHYVNLVAQVIYALDSSSAQERKSEVYRLKNGQAIEVQAALRSFLDQERQRVTQVLGQDAVGTAQRLLEREVAIVAEPVSNTLLLSANPRYFDQVKDIIEQLDQPQPQVLIQVLLAEVTLDSTRDLGVEWDFSRMIEGARVGAGTAFGVPTELLSFGGFSAVVTGDDYSFLLRALENDGRLEVLSRPQILTADNKPASINIGQRVPLITDSRVTQYGDTINSFSYQNVGVNLSVTPRIGADGAVSMEIGTTNSALSSSSVDITSGSGSGPGNNNNQRVVKIPIINERRATTSVSVQSGQSILIGGLISTTDDTRMKKVPFFGDIPGLGLLFRSRTKFSDRKELLILLTPQVLINDQQNGKIGDPSTITREQLERSQIRSQFNRDELQRQLLEPVFPDLQKPAEEPPQGKDSDKPKLQPVPPSSPL